MIREHEIKGNFARKRTFEPRSLKIISTSVTVP